MISQKSPKTFKKIGEKTWVDEYGNEYSWSSGVNPYEKQKKDHEEFMSALKAEQEKYRNGYKPEIQDVTEEPLQTISPVQTLSQTQSYVQTVPQTQSYVQYVPVVTKPNYKKIILVGGGIILFAILLKKVIR